MAAANFGNIIKDFCETFGIEDDQSRKTDVHRQLSGSENARIGSNVEKLSSTFSIYNINFDPFYAVYNILTKKVLQEKKTTRSFKLRL